MNGSVLNEKASFKMLGSTFSSKLVLDSSLLLKLASRKLEPCSMKFLSPPCKERYHAWAGAPSCYFKLLKKLQKRICRTVGSSLVASHEHLAHRGNLASLSLFYKYYFARCSYELAQLVKLPYSLGRSTLYSDRLHDFSVPFPRCYKNV